MWVFFYCKLNDMTINAVVNIDRITVFIEISILWVENGSKCHLLSKILLTLSRPILTQSLYIMKFLLFEK